MPQWKSSIYSQSISTTSSVVSAALKEGGSDFENFNPNFLHTSNNNYCCRTLDDNKSPKQSAVVEVNKKDRKKCKPTNHSFLNNCDFSAVNTLNENDKNHQVNRKSLGKIPTLASDSFLELARIYGEVDHAWNTSTTISYSSDWNENKEDVHGNLYAVDLFSPASYSFHN